MALLSPVQTIVDAPAASLHDLIDAYALFSARLRPSSLLLDAPDALPPVLAPLQHYSHPFVLALRHHVRLALVDPFPTHISDDAIQHARDSSSLSHHALCVLATILRYPAFQLVFPERDLSILFSDILDIALANPLPTFNSAKARSLSLWALGCHRLPLSVVESRRDDLCSALQMCLHGAAQPFHVVLDAHKAISHTIDRHPAGFLGALSPLLPHVLRNLHSESAELRLLASVVLGRFANALIRHTELAAATWKTISNHILSFWEPRCDESQIASCDMNILRISRIAFSAGSHSCPKYAPAWVLALLASIIVLCGPALYESPTVLRVILQALAMALTHKRSIVRALHPHAWRCFVWTFSQMLHGPENVEPTFISSAFHVIKQEVSGGIGVALATVLLSNRTSDIRFEDGGDRVSQALLVIEAMVRADSKHTRREGFMLLQALTSDSRTGHQYLQDVYEFPASALLDETIISAEWSNLPSAVRSIPKIPVPVPRLENTEIVRHYETLLGIWKQFALKVDVKESYSALIDVWRSILFACPYHDPHGDTTVEILRHTASVIIEFLPSVVLEDWEPDWGSWDVRDQLGSLILIDGLWSVMREVFGSLSLAGPAELILASVLKYAFHVLDHEVRTSWGKLCASLMTVASPSFLCDTHEPTASQLILRDQRELWGVVATSLSSSEVGLDWKELAKFLAIPVCAWALSEPELEAWETLLRSAIALANDPAMLAEYLVVQHLQGKEVDLWESMIPVLGVLLTYTHKPLPAELLTMVDTCLTASYSRARHSPEALGHSLGLLRVIRRMIASNVGGLTQILRNLRSSLCLWIGDIEGVMSDDQFNSAAVTLYCEVLKVLKVLPPSIQSLRDTEDFLACAFSRIPAPATAPFAFENFWRATYRGHTEFYDDLPAKIKSCLACFVAAYGGDLADGLSLTSGSESQSQSINNDAGHLLGSSQNAFICGSRFQPSSLQMLTGAQVHVRVSDAEATISRHQDDNAFVTPSHDDDPSQSIALRELQEYSSRVETSSSDGFEQSTHGQPVPFSPVFPSRGAMPSSRPPERKESVTSAVLSRKRKLAESVDKPQKRRRALRGILRTIRKLGSEPATRDVTPVEVPRMHSLPLKRTVFDCVELPTFREVLRRERPQTGENSRGTGPCSTSVSQSSLAQYAEGHIQSVTPRSVVPSPTRSDDDLDWEDFYVHATSSEADIDLSLLAADLTPPQTTPASATSGDVLDSIDEPCAPVASGSSLRKQATLPSQGESASGSSHASVLRRAKTAFARLDALRDVYSTVEANGASQIPMSELLQATRLVHQIGAALTERMDRRMGTDLG